MRHLSLFLLVAASAPARTTSSFDAGWLFHLNDIPNAEQSAFDDSSWRKLDLPHDWSIEGPFGQQNPAGGAGAFLPAGTGWYRKHFILPAAASTQRVFIEFDGVMANSDVWVNGTHLGKRPYGYVSFRYELTGSVNFGGAKPNVVAVRVDDSQQPASRWAPGAGIYRHVRLIVSGPVHVDQWATFVTTKGSTVHIRTTVVNQSDAPSAVSVAIAILNRVVVKTDSKMIQRAEREEWQPAPVSTMSETNARTIAPGKSEDFESDIELKNPDLWDLDRPNLYRAEVNVQSAGRTVDEDSVSFGIRDFHFDPNSGFWLNGRNFKIKGVCIHAELGALGAAVPIGAWQHHLEILRRLGVNAIRTAHNPPSPDFLDLCDRMGFLVMDEIFDCWTVAKNPFDYHLFFREWSKLDTRDTVRRDRNHPSIILYSAGNEIHDTPNAALASEILKGLVAVFHDNDPTRPVTQALFRPNVSHDYDNGLADLLDVVGQNYRENELLAAHKQNPARKIIGTENGMERRVWLDLRDHPEMAGQFLWAGIDYLGESRSWPVVGSASGLIDRTGAVKPLGRERQSWWSDRPMVAIARRVSPEEAAALDPGYELVTDTRRQNTFADWTPRNPSPHLENVEVYSNCQEVELFLNGKSLGAQKLHSDDSARTWQVSYEPGTLKAIGRNAGQAAATDELRSAGKAKRIELSAAPAYDGIVFITANIVDENGVTVPGANNLISFDIRGNGRILAVDNGDNSSQESFQARKRSAYQGRAVAIVRGGVPAGPSTVFAESANLSPATLAFNIRE
jgi:beta-galactosidase